MATILEENYTENSNDESPAFCNEYLHSLSICTENDKLGHKHMIYIYRIYKNPDILLVTDLLKTEECDVIINLFENQLLNLNLSMENKISEGNGSNMCDTLMIPKSFNSFINTIENRIANIMNIDPRHLDPLLITRYQPGHIFSEQHDGPTKEKSLMVYLSDCLEGGETCFHKIGLVMPANKGSAMCWKNRYNNGELDTLVGYTGLPLLKGDRYILNCFSAYIS